MMKKDDIPKHIAIIMDGNGRWAKQHRLPRFAGHREGIRRIEEISKGAKELGVKILTLFAFSTENWQRPKREVNMLMKALESYLRTKLNDLVKSDIRLCVIGRREPTPDYLWRMINKAKHETEHNNGLILNIAFNYGSRTEIVDAVKIISKKVKQDELNYDDINEYLISKSLYTKDLPDPDLLIRTSGEQRISNFLLWQSSYTELYFTKKFWPDFTKNDLQKAIVAYQKRDRRFGRI